MSLVGNIDWTLMGRIYGILEQIEELPYEATGVMTFEGGAGRVLIESKSVCWAASRRQKQRLTDILRHQRTPPLDPSFIEEVCAACKRSGTPIGEALVASGAITEDGLRAALLEQACEALVELARASAEVEAFVPYVKANYNARNAFSTAEIVAAIGAMVDRGRAKATAVTLRELMVPDARGYGFVTFQSMPRPLPVAVTEGSMRVSQLRELGGWISDLFAMSGAIDDGIDVALASLRGCALVTWRSYPSLFVALCANQAASARLLAKLAPPVAGGGR